jgi:hypothetical protein
MGAACEPARCALGSRVRPTVCGTLWHSSRARSPKGLVFERRDIGLAIAIRPDMKSYRHILAAVALLAAACGTSIDNESNSTDASAGSAGATGGGSIAGGSGGGGGGSGGATGGGAITGAG